MTMSEMPYCRRHRQEWSLSVIAIANAPTHPVQVAYAGHCAVRCPSVIIPCQHVHPSVADLYTPSFTVTSSFRKLVPFFNR